MSNNAHIDKIFKDGLGENNFSGKETMWEQMEATLDKETNKKKRRVGFIILFACLFIAGGAVLFNNLRQNTTIPTLVKNNTTATEDASAVAATAGPKEDKDIVVADDNKIAASVTVVSNTSTPKRFATLSRYQANITNAGAEEETDATTNNNLLQEKFLMNANLIEMQAPAVSIVKVNLAKASNTYTAKPGEPKTEIQPVKKFTIEVLAGSDIFKLNKKVGYYAGIRINKMLDKGTVISAGVNYSFNSLNEKYRLSTKPAQQQGADAQINSIKMIRFPVYFQRQLPNSKFALMAGLVPSYIVDAAVYNVPGSFTGNPDQYRKFSMNDINRLNILFGAGIKYSPLKRISFEVSGSYGFTSLVKNSYINQSRVNDNFKNIQAGVVFQLK